MNSKQLIAVAAVVILVIAGVVAAYTLTRDGGGEGGGTVDYGSDLKVFGNANMDSAIDQADIDYINDYLNGDVELTEFCDANRDGKVDVADAEYVQDLIDRRDGTVVWYVDGIDEIQSVTWPLDTFVVLSNSPQLMALAVGLDDTRIIGYTKADSVLFQSFEGAALLSSSSLDDITVMTSNGIPDAIITQSSYTTAITKETRDLYAQMGTDIISVAGMDGAESASSALTLGFLVDCVEQSQEYSKWCTDMLAEIEQKLSAVPDSERKTALVWYGGFACAGYDDQYTAALELAGGKTVADWTGYQPLDADRSTWVLNYHPEYMIRIFTMGYSSTEDSRQALYEKYGSIIEGMDAYKNGNFCVIDFTLPQTLRIAYMAEFLYPEIFGEGYADQWHQRLVDIYGLDYDVDGQFIFTAEDVK